VLLVSTVEEIVFSHILGDLNFVGLSIFSLMTVGVCFDNKLFSAFLHTSSSCDESDESDVDMIAGVADDVIDTLVASGTFIQNIYINIYIKV